MSAHWLPQDVYDDFAPALDDESWTVRERAIVQAFLIWAQPYRHERLLHRAAEVYRRHSADDIESGALCTAFDAVFARFIGAVSHHQGFMATAHYRMSHPFLASLIDIDEGTQEHSTSAYIYVLQTLGGWRGLAHEIALADHYYEQILDLRGSLLHVAERQPTNRPYTPREIEERVLQCHEDAEAFDQLPSDYSRVANLKSKLSSVVRLIDGRQILGAKPRHLDSDIAEREAAAREMTAIDDLPPLPSPLTDVMTTHQRQIHHLSQHVRLVRRAVSAERETLNTETSSLRQATALKNLTEASEAEQAAAVREVAGGGIPPLLKPLKDLLIPFCGASEHVVHARLTGMANALAKANNPSPTQTTIHTRAQVVRWLQLVAADNEPLASLLFIVWSLGVHPRRLVARPAGAALTDSTVSMDEDTQTLTYRVLGHHAVTTDEQLPLMRVQLPRPVADGLSALNGSLDAVDAWQQLQDRYRKVRKSLPASGMPLPRFVQTWRHSQPGFTERRFSAFERHLLQGDLPFADWSHSAYVTTDLGALNARYREATTALAEEARRSQLSAVQGQTAGIHRLLTSLDTFAGRAPSGHIGSTALNDAPALRAFVSSLQRHATGTKRRIPWVTDRDQLMDETRNHLNLMAMNYFLLLLAHTVGRPHSQRMIVDDTAIGLRIEDKDSAHFTEFRIVAPASGDQWLKGKSVLQEQHIELNKAAEQWEAYCRKSRLTIRNTGVWRKWEPVCIKISSGGEFEWQRLSDARFRRLASELMEIHDLGFRLNHFRHVVASSSHPLSDVERRSLLGHTHPGLNYWAQDCSQRIPLTETHPACVKSLVSEYGLRAIKAPRSIESGAPP